MLKQFVEKVQELVDMGQRSTIEEVAGRVYMLDPGEKKYQLLPKWESPNKQHKFGTVEAITRYLLDLGERVKNKDCVIIVNPKGVYAHLDEESEYRKDLVIVPFFAADLPPYGAMDYEELLLYLDQHQGHIEDEQNIRMLLQHVKVRNGQELSLRDAGASIQVEVKASKGADSEVDGQRVEIPKKITINLRIGTREYIEPHQFRLAISINSQGAPAFKLIHLDRDNALDSFMQRCINDIKGQLGEGWRIYQGD